MNIVNFFTVGVTLIYVLLQPKSSETCEGATNIRPILIFPGLASNRLFQLKPTEYYNSISIWLPDYEAGLYPMRWNKILQLKYIEDNNTVTDNKSKVDVLGMMYTYSIENLLDGSPLGYIFYEMVEFFRLNGWGRHGNQLIYGIPMDWRKSVKDLDDEYYETLAGALQSAYGRYGKNIKVVLVCHSYGCLNLAEFVRRNSAEFLEERISQIITLGAPWGGSMVALQALISGYSFGYESLVNPLLFRQAERTFTSLFHLIPVSEVLEYPFLITINNKTYKYEQIKAVLDQFGIQSAMLQGRKEINLLINAFDKLDGKVNFTCIYGNNVTTINGLVYEYDGRSISDTEPKLTPIRNKRGDGTVGLKSLELCSQKDYFHTLELKSIEHLQIIKEPSVFHIIRNLSIF